MTDVAKDRDEHVVESTESIKAKRWDEALEKPALDYSEFFDSDVGSLCGITIWEIENFIPKQVEDKLHGKFYEGDCYIVLSSFLDENQSLDWKIFFWIGEKSALDKRTCSAMHALNLRNYIGANCRTAREEQADESEEFLKLFEGNMQYLEGARTASGFYTVEDIDLEDHVPDNWSPVTPRLYSVGFGMGYLELPQAEIPANKLKQDLLNTKNVYILDCFTDLRKNGELVRSKQLMDLIPQYDGADDLKLQIVTFVIKK